MTPTVDADEAGLRRATEVLRAGQLVVIPTDTVYGLAVDATVAGATDALFVAKGRPRRVPIAVLVAEEADAWAVAADPVPEAARQLASEWWPGALTLVVPRAGTWAADLGDDDGTVGLRCPDHDWVRGLCRRTGPLATTSANRHGGATPREARGVASLLGASVSLIVDGGPLAGSPSTVVDCTGPAPRLLREGRLRATDLGLS